LLALAQLFVIATMNNALSTNVSEGLNDCQRLIEDFRIEAAVNGVEDSDGNANPQIVSGNYAITHYDSEKSTEYVYVLDEDGNIVESDGTRVAASGYFASNEGTDLDAYYGNPADGKMAAPSKKSRLVIVRLVPINPDPRFNQTVTIVSVVNGR
jgi:hypothetical protein